MQGIRTDNIWTRNGDDYSEETTPEYESLAHLVLHYNETFSDKKALGYRKILRKESSPTVKYQLDSDYTWITHREMKSRVDDIVRGLLAIGVKSKDNVSFFMETRLEWFLLLEAVFRINATVATIYTTLDTNGVVHCLNESKSPYVVTSNGMLPRLASIKQQVPHMKKVLVVRDEVNGHLEKLIMPEIEGSDLVMFEELCQHSLDTSGHVHLPSSEDTAFILYTSGSTNAPKGVILTHGAFINSIRVYEKLFWDHQFEDDAKYLCYLPLAHIFELQMSHVFMGLGLGVGFGSPGTLIKNSPALLPGCVPDLEVLKPEIMISVPAMLDRMRKVAESHGQSSILDEKRRSLGGKLKYTISGGALILPETQMFTESVLGIRMIQDYGATETGGLGTIMNLNDETIGTVGPPNFGVKIKLVNWPEGEYRTTDQPNPRGEIWISSKSNSKGYLLREDLTEESFEKDTEGLLWFKTGDIGEFMPNGSLKIVERKKFLMKIQKGEYVSPARIESVIKGCALVDDACVFARRDMNFTVAVVKANPEALRLVMTSSPCAGGASDNALVGKIHEVIIKWCDKSGLARYEIPRKIKLVADDWTPDSGLVTALRKIKRDQMQTFYKDTIDQLFKNTHRICEHVEDSRK